ncbi:MAG: KamA family radical SAM protein [Zetaproteobacteria bacterium]|nr:KamA family radical SAM protein [Zetaproteobacteria bacterium]
METICAKEVVSAAEMDARGWLDAQTAAVAPKLAESLDFKVSPPMTTLIDAGVEEIKRQFVPSYQELDEQPYEQADPIGDDAHGTVPGITHRYPDRVLLNISHTCAVYCRFCFRKEKVSKSGHSLNSAQMDQALDYIGSHPQIREVIFSGGDPLILAPRLLRRVLMQLDRIEHVKLIRFHTRVPVVRPERVDAALIQALTATRKVVRVIVHVNSAKELTSAAEGAILCLVRAAIPVLSQSVLLKGVNDSLTQLLDLFWKLIEMRVSPYYLHYLDPARGTTHFRVPLQDALELFSQLRGKIPGYAIPRFMVDIPGGHGKISLDAHNMRYEGGKWYFLSPLEGQQWVEVSYPTNEDPAPVHEERLC